MFEYLIYYAAGFVVNLFRLGAARHYYLQNNLQGNSVSIYKQLK
jgi:hypothetical protein